MRAGGGIVKHSDDSDVIAMQLKTTCYGKNKKFIRDLGFKPWLCYFLALGPNTCMLNFFGASVSLPVKWE